MRRRLTRAGFIAMASLLALSVAGPVSALEPESQPPFSEPIRWLGPDLKRGDQGIWVSELQNALRREGFPVYDADGRYGRSTWAAVRVFSKVHNITDEYGFQSRNWELLVDGTPLPGRGGEETRIEIDLAKQLLFLIDSGQVHTVLPVSTASGGRYENFYGQTVTSRTPEGRFELYNRRFGWHESYLGEMYNPYYFTGGYAIHGSPVVPWHPASHGCVRVRMSDMRWLKDALAIGIPVYVYGKRQERKDVFEIPRLIPLDEITPESGAIA